MRRLLPLLVLALALQCAAARAHAQDGELRESSITVPRGGAVLALRDLDGDGSADLLRLDRRGAGARFLRAGRYPEADDAFLPWPAGRVAWDVADLEADGASELVVLVDGREVRAFRPRPDGFGEGELLLEASSYLPAGVNRMDFVRDVDGDGRADLVLPGAGRYELYLARDAGWSDPIPVAVEADVQHELGDPGSLTGRFGQWVSLPWFTVEDVDGDGRRDLVAREEDSVSFHLAAPELSAEPTWRLDLAALRAELPKSDGFDFDDLLSNVTQRVEWRIADLDGKAPSDLVVMLGSTFKVYSGASTTGPVRSPDQVLKSSGNVLHFFLRDVMGDARPELQIARGERVSLGRLLRYLVLPGKLDFDLFTYANEGGTFGRAPAKRATLGLRIPRLLSFLNDKDFEAKLEARLEVPTLRVALDADGVLDDVADLSEGKLVVFRGRAPDPALARGRDFEANDFDTLVESLLLRDLDALEDGGEHTIDLGAIEEWALTTGAELRQACEGAKPALVHPLPEGADSRELVARDIDGDGVTDYLILDDVGEDVRLTILVPPMLE